MAVLAAIWKSGWRAKRADASVRVGLLDFSRHQPAKHLAVATVAAGLAGAHRVDHRLPRGLAPGSDQDRGPEAIEMGRFRELSVRFAGHRETPPRNAFCRINNDLIGIKFHRRLVRLDRACP